MTSFARQRNAILQYPGYQSRSQQILRTTTYNGGEWCEKHAGPERESEIETAREAIFKKRCRSVPPMALRLPSPWNQHVLTVEKDRRSLKESAPRDARAKSFAG